MLVRSNNNYIFLYIVLKKDTRFKYILLFYTQQKIEW